MKRKGTAGSEELEGNLATLGGRPRSVEGFPAELRGARRRRSGDEVLEDEDSVSCSTFLLVVYIYLHIDNKSKLAFSSFFYVSCLILCVIVQNVLSR